MAELKQKVMMVRATKLEYDPMDYGFPKQNAIVRSWLVYVS
jgi:hypothetical protein